MNILITNDDGFGAAGLSALRDIAAAYGRVAVVAPDAQHSMKSHAITTGSDLEIRRVNHDDRSWTCSGTPADCIRLGLRYLPLGPIDVVLSGINHGANLGVDLFYSGTVAAAREAALLGVPAIAVSQLTRKDVACDWEAVRRSAGRALAAVWHGVRNADDAVDLDPQGVQPDPTALPPLTNVNLPCPGDGPPRGVHVRSPTLAAMPARFHPPYDGGHSTRARYDTGYFERPAPAGSDVEAVFGGYICISRMNVDGSAVDA